jgi:small-conductance mechanosensitive channel
MSRAVGATLAALLLAALLHYALSRAGARLPRWRARRRGAAPGPHPPGERAFALGARLAQVGLWLAFAGFASEALPELRGARDLALRLLAKSFRAPLFTLSEMPYTILDLLALPLLLIGVWLAASLLVRGLRAWLLRAAGVEEGVQETAAVLLRYALCFLGALVVLQAWGVDVRSLAILGSVLGVGIGFGLQNVANNFASGILLNLGREIRPGDFVAVGGLTGTVKRVGARSTWIQTLDEVAILVPNSRFLEGEVVNWSHGDPRSRIHVPVGVAYGSDVARVRRALLEAARGHPAVLREPRPQVQLRRFGESSLDFELLVWIPDPRDQFSLVSDLNLRVEESLRRHGIQIPFPQRDLHLRSPEALGLLAALGGRLPDGVELPAAPAPAFPATPPAPRPAATLEPAEAHEGGPEEWGEAELEAVAARMRATGGVAIADRRHLFAVYPGSFVGREAVDWLVRHEGLTRGEAVRLGQRLVDRGAVRHVLDEHGFRDGHFFYRFGADGAAAPEGAR